MTLSASLQEFQKSLSCCTYNGAQHSHILITESDPLAKLKSVKLIASNGDWISFNPDEGRKCKRIHQRCNIVVMSPLLAIGTPGLKLDHHRACDCVVVINKNDTLKVLYVDLKSGNPADYENQFKSTRQFFRYTLGLLNDFNKAKFTLGEEIYVILYGGMPALINKKPTVPKQMTVGATTPNKPHMREVPQPATLYLKELLS